MKVMFMGTPDIAVPCLEMLNRDFEVCAVVTQTDKPKGRGHKMAYPPVKEKALQLCIDVFQPKTLKDCNFNEVLKKYNPDVIVVIAYGKILPKYVLDYPKYGCINVHASLLPRYRGAAPIQWAIVNGEEKSGVTTMMMSEGLDTGDMLLKAEIDIIPEMTGGELHDKMSEICPVILKETLDNLNNIVPQKQSDEDSCYAPLIDKETCRIDWNKSNREIYNLVRGMNPFPCAYTSVNQKKLKIYKTKMCNTNGKTGSVLCSENKLIIGCGSGSIEITELQMEGKKRMNTTDFLRGYTIEEGTILG